jgi:hypothetical protein
MLKPVSQIKLDVTGIALTADFPAAVPLDTSKLTLTSASAALIKDHAPNSGRLDIGDDDAALRFQSPIGNVVLKISGAEATITNSIGPKFSVSQTEVKAKAFTNSHQLDAAGFAVTAGAGSLSVEDAESSIAVGGQSVAVSLAGVKMTCGASQVEAMAIGITAQGLLIRLG